MEKVFKKKDYGFKRLKRRKKAEGLPYRGLAG